MEGDHVGSPGGLAAQSQRGLDGLAAGVREEQPVQARGQHLAEALDQRQQRPVHDGRVLRVNQGADLLLSSLDDPRMAVPGAGHPDTGGEVEVAPVLLVVEDRALPAGGQHAGGLFEDGGKCGHGESLIVGG